MIPDHLWTLTLYKMFRFWDIRCYKSYTDFKIDCREVRKCHFQFYLVKWVLFGLLEAIRENNCWRQFRWKWYFQFGFTATKFSRYWIKEKNGLLLNYAHISNSIQISPFAVEDPICNTEIWWEIFRRSYMKYGTSADRLRPGFSPA